MKKAKVILSAVAILAVAGGALAFKARSEHTFFKVDAANPNPALRVCTLEVETTYTTNPALGLPGAPAIIQTTYYTAPVNSTVCPQTTLFSAD
jgi:hypothetical protein